MKIVMCLLLLLTAACTKDKAVLKSEEDKAFYSMGALYGARLKDLSLSDQELANVVVGLKEGARGKTQVNANEFQMKIQSIIRDKMKIQADKVKKDGETFIANFLKEDGVKKTESGLAYKVIKPGTGKRPKAEDKVEVHYHGTLIDGTVFDSSVERGKTIEFPLNRVIKGWTEGLQLIGEGGKVKLVIPSELGYGDRGAPPKIPGGSTLIFEVELFKVAKNSGAKLPKGHPKLRKKKKK